MQKTLKFRLLRQWYFFIRNSDDKYFYRLYGLRRSGNHALLNWIMAQVPGMSCLNNNMGAFHPPGRTPIKRMSIHGFGRRNLLISHEDKPLIPEIIDYREKTFGKAKKKFHILLLRDPYNWMASQNAWKDKLGKKFREDADYRNKMIALWKKYACTYLEWCNDNPEQTPVKQIPVNYNQWVSSKDYRKGLAQKLNIDFTDKGREEVAGHGHGSSFSGRKLHGRGSELRVLERWKKYKDDPEFTSWFDNEIITLGKEIFGMDKPF